MKSELKLLDCTIRDGGYMNDWKFDKKMVREAYRALSKSGVDIVEIGFRGSEKYCSREKFGMWRFSDDDFIREVTEGIEGAKIAVMGDYGKIETEDFAEAAESPVEIVRLAVHKDNIKPCLILLSKIKEKGYEVSLNAMGYSGYTATERRELVKLLRDADIDYLYVADSYGSIFPFQIEQLFEPLLSLSHIKIGFHPHNNLQMAFANTLEAIRCGVDIIDSTLYGIGRAAGNLPTEVIILYLELSKGGKYNAIPLLNCVDTFLIPLKQEFKWGYQLPYMLSGMYQCHPNYAMNLLKYKAYNIEDISIAMERINSLNPIGYSQEVLDKVIAEGMIGRLETASGKKEEPEVIAIPYIERHRDKDFLILANGPTLTKYKEKIDRFIVKHDPIILGANNLSGLFKPHYHVFNNKKRFSMYADTIAMESVLMVSQYFEDEFVREYTSRTYERMYYKDRLDLNFDIRDGVVQSNCRTISVLLLGVAIVMGAKRIFAAGLDGYLTRANEGIHFYKEIAELADEDMLVELHQQCLKFIGQIDQYQIKKGLEGIHILTPTDYKAFYKSVENYI
jgi:4-hydroxy 2-oxovalerate aldolase